MTHGISVVHRLGALPFAVDSGPFIVWRTCVRQIALGLGGDWAQNLAQDNDEVLHGESAYRFLLEVICGLHSPVLGETEVFGQFKTLIKNIENEDWAHLHSLKTVFQALLADAKNVREGYLSGLGAQSYGSLVRKYTKGLDRIAVVGSGQLAEEIIPWLIKAQRTVTVFARNPQKAERLKSLGAVHIVALSDKAGTSFQNQDAIVIAAPIEAQAVVRMSSDNGQFQVQQILDLRGESEVDPINLPHVIDLQKIFSELKLIASRAGERAEKARKTVRELSQNRFHQVKIRPFGWDDLCA